jgi:hypothetical protein
MRDEMTLRLQQAEQNSENISDIKSFSKAFRNTYENERYIVIAGSSPRKKDLENLLEDIRMKTGNDPEDLFPELHIRKSKSDPGHFMLILEENITFQEARKAREKAIHFGFRSDTFFKRLT